MIGLDTNVLIRYLVQDDLKQFQKAEQIIEAAISERKVLHITLVVLCEVVWVLSYHYEISQDKIFYFLELILHADHIEIEDRQLALDAFFEYQNSKGDFADCLIGLTNLSLGCTTTYTFDKKAAKLPSFTMA